jgi:hypothetical protein
MCPRTVGIICLRALSLSTSKGNCTGRQCTTCQIPLAFLAQRCSQLVLVPVLFGGTDFKSVLIDVSSHLASYFVIRVALG